MLRKNEEIVTAKADKRNVTVVMKKKRLQDEGE